MAYIIRLSLILLICLVAMPSISKAQQINIAVVDVEKILNESKAGKSIQSQLATKREAFQKEFAGKENALMESQKALIEQKKDMSPEDFAKKRREFEKQLLETKNLFQKRRSALDKGLGNALSKLRKTIIEVTAQVADKGKYQVVLTRDSVVIIEKEMDITDQVLSQMDAKISSITLSVSN